MAEIQYLSAKQLIAEYPFWKTLGGLYMARCRKKAPPAIRVGGTLRWRRADVEAWLAARLEPQPEAVQRS